jgi:hypothetical protein
VGVGELLGVGSELWTGGESLGAGSVVSIGESLGSTGIDESAAGAAGVA